VTLVGVLPWLTSAGVLAQVATVRRRPVLGFGIGLAVQPLWVLYSFLTGAWGFLVATAGFVAVNGWNLWKAIRGADA